MHLRKVSAVGFVEQAANRSSAVSHSLEVGQGSELTFREHVVMASRVSLSLTAPATSQDSSDVPRPERRWRSAGQGKREVRIECFVRMTDMAGAGESRRAGLPQLQCICDG